MESPAVAPWDTEAIPPDPDAEKVVRSWLAGGDVSAVTVDDGGPAARLVDAAHTKIDDIFSAGNQVAFHAAQHGTLAGDDPRFTGDGPAVLHLAGVASVAGGRVAGGRVIRDRLGLLRRLSAQSRDAGA